MFFKKLLCDNMVSNYLPLQLFMKEVSYEENFTIR